MFGYQSETHMPLWPYCFHLRGEGISVLDAVPMAVITLPNDSGIGCPARRSSSGLGSKRSMWLGPPSMKSQITDFAVGMWSGFLGASGSGGSAAWSMEEMASAPRPPQERIRNSRRSCPLSGIHKLVRVQKHLAEVDEGGRGRGLHGRRRRRGQRELVGGRARGDHALLLFEERC